MDNEIFDTLASHYKIIEEHDEILDSHANMINSIIEYEQKNYWLVISQLVILACGIACVIYEFVKDCRQRKREAEDEKNYSFLSGGPVKN